MNDSFARALLFVRQGRYREAESYLRVAIQNDPETEVKKRAVFALSQLPKDESVPQLIHVADTNASLAPGRRHAGAMGAVR